MIRYLTTLLALLSTVPMVSASFCYPTYSRPCYSTPYYGGYYGGYGRSYSYGNSYYGGYDTEYPYFSSYGYTSYYW